MIAKYFLSRHLATVLMVVGSLLLSAGCTLQAERTTPVVVDNEQAYSIGESVGDGPLAGSQKWWLNYPDRALHILVAGALPHNLSIREAVSRLRQAAIRQEQAGAALYPPVDIGYDYMMRKENGAGEEKRNELRLSVSWEVDLWGRLANAKQAADFLEDAAEEELQEVALVISFALGSAYFELVEQQLEEKLLEQQAAVNAVYLDLTELRFANGAASVVDVYQQRQLLTAKRADILLVKERIVELNNRLLVLSGKLPGTAKIVTDGEMAQLPATLSLGIPADLLVNRPDLRRLQAQLAASDHEVAAAIADRLPQIRIGGGLGVSDGTPFHSLFAGIVGPLLDWDLRRQEVERRRAAVEEKVAQLTGAFLRAVEEVENGLWRERHHKALIETVEQQLDIAQSTLRESRNRYVQGVTDYLPVLAALQTLQNLERQLLRRKLELTLNRVDLTKALGGSVLDGEIFETVSLRKTPSARNMIQ